MPIIQKCFIVRKVTKNLQISVQRKLPFLHLISVERLIYYAKMKRILIFLLTVLTLISCSDLRTESRSDIIYDITPIVLHIYVNDADGRNLLDGREGSLDTKNISAAYEGETYSVELQTKYYMPSFRGLVLKKDSAGNNKLVFGELDGAKNLDYVDLVISWGNGTSDTITIFNDYKVKSNGKLDITRRFYVNGKKMDSDIAKFVFVK
mgnify:FL=1